MSEQEHVCSETLCSLHIVTEPNLERDKCEFLSFAEVILVSVLTSDRTRVSNGSPKTSTEVLDELWEFSESEGGEMGREIHERKSAYQNSAPLLSIYSSSSINDIVFFLEAVTANSTSRTKSKFFTSLFLELVSNNTSFLRKF